jgi:prolipoprotein diacylglyceryltransferase
LPQSIPNSAALAIAFACSSSFAIFVEFNSEYHSLGLSFTQAELISVILILLGIIGIFWSLKNGKKYQAA